MLLRRIRSLGSLFGIDFVRMLRSARAFPQFWRQRSAFRQKLVQNESLAADFPMGKLYPCFDDANDTSGSASGHYFHQDLLVARRIYERNPKRHVDVGSRVDGFVAHVACFREIEVFDIRPLESRVRNLVFRRADLMNEIPAELRGCCDSLSCLHTLEHFGLGRYGDPIAPDGHTVGLRNLAALLKPTGTLYLSVPIGAQRIEFNAHRVFDVSYLVRVFSGEFELLSFSYVDDAGDLHENVSVTSTESGNNFNCHYGCGIFELRKRSSFAVAAS